MPQSGQGVDQGGLIKLLKALRNRVYTQVALAVSGTTTLFKITNTATYTINGAVYTKTTADVAALTGLTNTGAGEFCKLRVEIDTAGAITAVQGGMAAAQVLAPVPSRSANKATLGIVEIPASFVFGTTAFTGLVFVDGDPDLNAQALEG